MATPWDVDGYFSGTVEGEPVNCRLRVRLTENGTEVWVKAIGDTEHESAVSHSPMVHGFAEWAITQFHQARAYGASSAVDPAPPIDEESRLIRFPVDRALDRSLVAASARPTDPSQSLGRLG